MANLTLAIDEDLLKQARIRAFEGTDWLEFDSMINLRPSFGNRSRGVDDQAMQQAIADLVDRVVRR